MNVTLKWLATQTDLTPGYLSQIENGRTEASITALRKICSAVHLPLGELLTERGASATHVLRFKDSTSRLLDGAIVLPLAPSNYDHLDATLVILEPAGVFRFSSVAHCRSEKLLFVLEGKVSALSDEDVHVLGPLDTLSHAKDAVIDLHEYTGEKSAKVLCISTPFAL